MKNSRFLSNLEHQASLQAKLNSSRLLPKQLDSITSLIGNYPWQTLLAISGITAIFFS